MIPHLPSTEALKEAEHIRRGLIRDFKTVESLRSRVEFDARALIAEMAILGGSISRLKEILPEHLYTDFLKKFAARGDANACLNFYQMLNQGGKTELELFADLKFFETKDTHDRS